MLDMYVRYLPLQSKKCRIPEFLLRNMLIRRKGRLQQQDLRTMNNKINLFFGCKMKTIA